MKNNNIPIGPTHDTHCPKFSNDSRPCDCGANMPIRCKICGESICKQCGYCAIDHEAERERDEYKALVEKAREIAKSAGSRVIHYRALAKKIIARYKNRLRKSEDRAKSLEESFGARVEDCCGDIRESMHNEISNLKFKIKYLDEKLVSMRGGYDLALKERDSARAEYKKLDDYCNDQISASVEVAKALEVAQKALGAIRALAVDHPEYDSDMENLPFDVAIDALCAVGGNAAIITEIGLRARVKELEVQEGRGDGLSSWHDGDVESVG